MSYYGNLIYNNYTNDIYIMSILSSSQLRDLEWIIIFGIRWFSIRV